MKTAQDISPTAILCLALGLLIGNVLMPEHQKLETVAGWLPIQAATPVDLNEGRLLERVPDNLESSTQYSTEVTPATAQADQKSATAVQELTDLSQQLRAAEKPTPMSDASAWMMITCFITLGMAMSYTDVIQFSEECDSSEAVTENTQEVVSSAVCLRGLKYVVLCISVMAVLASGIQFCSSCSNSLAGSNNSDELSMLGNGSTKERPALAPDSVVALVLGAWAVLSLFVMKSDNREMAEEEARRAPSMEVEEKQMSRPSHARMVSKLLAIVTFLAVLASVAVASLPDGQSSAAPNNIVEHASITELKYLSQLFDGSYNILVDFVLELSLGACALLGMAVMRVDLCEMVRQLQDESGRKVIKAS